MIKNYFKIALRGFWKHKLFTLINIISLSIGISGALTIYLIVHFDFTFDKFHNDSDRIYRVFTNYHYLGQSGSSPGVTAPLPDAVKAEVTGLEKSAPVFEPDEFDVGIPNGSKIRVKFNHQDNIILVDERYFDLFQYKWIAGSAKMSLNAPYQVVLTSSQAKIYFPSLPLNQVLGKQIIYNGSIKTTVSGIVNAFDENTDFKFHDFISFATGTRNHELNDQVLPDNWSNESGASQFFIKLSEKSTVTNIEKQLNYVLKEHRPPGQDKNYSMDLHLEKLSDIHFDVQWGATANKNTLYGLMTVALFLLLLACINFINLTTAQASQRAKEIGIRKTMGSSRIQLIFQFLGETFFITLSAVIVAVAIAPFILKFFADFILKDIKLNFLNQPGLIIFLVLLTFVVSFFSGFYPALILSAYKPVAVLKNQHLRNQTRTTWVRKSSTVAQFVIAQFFIMATILISKQIYYALHKDLGFKKEAIVYISSPDKNNSAVRKQLFMNELRAIPQIERISIGDNPPSSKSDNTKGVSYINGKKEIKTDLDVKFGDENYINVYKIKLLAGRNLLHADTAGQAVINSTYAKILGFNNPKEAIGKHIDWGKRKGEIIGVVADFYQKSLHSAIRPLAIIGADDRHQNIFHVALKPQSPKGNEWAKAINGIQRAWKATYPDSDLDYRFFDESIAKFYESEQRTAQLLAWATGLSIFISCLGLLGLAIYTTNQRTKEIGVRKVLGATVAQIITLLSAELVLLIALAFIIVAPVAWLAMNKWMQSFADRTTISWWIFALSGGGMLLAAVFTSSFQTVKAAMANPVTSLRSE